MVIKSRDNLIGAYAFLVGVVLALFIGIAPAVIGQRGINFIDNPSMIYGALAIAGVLVGFSVGSRDLNTFLLAAVSVVIVSYMGLSSVDLIKNVVLLNIKMGLMAISTFNAFLILFIPATIVVALKTVFSIAKV